MLQIDTREKPAAIERIIKELDRKGVKHFRSKLYIGDYCNLHNPLVLIERKQNIDEIAKNATVDHKRFKAELCRLDDIGGKMYILIEQDKIDGKPIRSLEDLILWAPKHGTIRGDRIYRILRSWGNKHNIEYVFCSKRRTAAKIIELLDCEVGNG